MNRLAHGLALLSLLVSQQAAAASLRISPIGLDLSEKDRAASITLSNSAEEPVSLQIRIFKWTQVDGEDKLDPTDEMLVSPPAATVPAGASYTIRVARPSVTPVTSELAYRVFIDELPKPIDPETGARGISMVLRTSMPVFVTPEKAKAQLQWSVAPSGVDLAVTVRNSGARSVKVANLSATTKDGTPLVATEGLNGYVLAGVARTFKLAPESGKKLPQLASGSVVTITAKNRTDDIKEDVVVALP
ncbi:fimbrial biogenesis chaperone [Sphingomonas fennica]|nr:molecular chaperone [Sphingomonas fennica]